MHNLSQNYIDSMTVGYLFNEFGYRNDFRTQDWSCSEECAEFTKQILEDSKINNRSVNISFRFLHEELIEDINKLNHCEDHMWDDYCKGFLSGQIIGQPTFTNINLAKKANEMWEKDNGNEYGYYQEMLETIK